MAKVMIVDDSRSTRARIRKHLETSGHTVLEAGDGQQGLDILEREKDVNLVLCDIRMPRMDGLTMCRKLREIPRLNQLPILMLTTESSLEMRDQGKAFGLLGWITKPFREEEVVAAIERILKRP